MQKCRGSGHAGDDDPNANLDNPDCKSLDPGYKLSEPLLTLLCIYSQRCRLHPGR